MVKSLDEVIERLQYKADNIKAKLEPSYFTECIDYLKTLPTCKDCAGCTNWLCDCANTRAHAIDEFAEKIKHFMRSNVEDAEYFGDCSCEIFESEIDEIAEQMKGE